MFPTTCSNFNNSFEENVCLPDGAMGGTPAYDYSQSNLCQDPSNFDPNAMFDATSTCATVASICHSLRPHGGIVQAYASKCEQKQRNMFKS